MIEKQLGNAVVRGRKITFARTGEPPITGYLAGMDEGAFFVLAPEENGVRHYLISRADSPWQEIHREAVYGDEPRIDELESVIKTFREWVQKTLLRMQQKIT